MKEISPVQKKVLAAIDHKAPAWVIRAGRITTLEVLEKLGLIELRLGHYGWEARVTEKGQELIRTYGN